MKQSPRTKYTMISKSIEKKNANTCTVVYNENG